MRFRVTNMSRCVELDGIDFMTILFLTERSVKFILWGYFIPKTSPKMSSNSSMNPLRQPVPSGRPQAQTGDRARQARAALSGGTSNRSNGLRAQTPLGGVKRLQAFLVAPHAHALGHFPVAAFGSGSDWRRQRFWPRTGLWSGRREWKNEAIQDDGLC